MFRCNRCGKFQLGIFDMGAPTLLWEKDTRLKGMCFHCILVELVSRQQEKEKHNRIRKERLDNKKCPVCRTKSGVIQPGDNAWKQGTQPYREYKCSTCGKVWTFRIRR